MIVNSTPSTCTAKLLTGWNLPDVKSANEKTRVNARLNLVNNVKAKAKTDEGAQYLRDNAIIYLFVTQRQKEAGALDEILPKFGFKEVFEGKKSNEPGVQREQASGNLFMWAAEPKVFQDCTEAYLKELTALKAKIDPPKKPDPKRAEFPTNILSRMRLNGIVQDNSALKNRISDVLLVTEPTAYMFVKNTFGIDIRKWNNNGANWVNLTFNQLKANHKAWVEELL